MSRPRRSRGMAVSPPKICAAIILLQVIPAVHSAEEWSLHHSKLSGVIIPGFASTQLRAWSVLDCPYSPIDFNPLDSVWLDTRKVLSAVNCWLKCMLLDPYNQTDHPECKSRPDSGLSAITELDPGYITGPLSSVWKEWVRWCIEFGIEPNAILAAPYDWRLSASLLEERDLYFHKLKLTFETALKLRGGPSLVFAHSMGNNVFRYFLEWLKLEIAPKLYLQWLDDHIHAYFAVGAPLLGAAETVKATLSGFTFGLPIAEVSANSTSEFNSFGSSLWLTPFSKYCRADNTYWKHFFDGKGRGEHRSHCDDREFRSNYSGWPTNIINIEIPSMKAIGTAYPSFSNEAPAVNSDMECGLPIRLSFSAREVSDGTFFKAIQDFDPDSQRLLYMLQKSGNLVEGVSEYASGDETVPYHSLSWCKSWLGPRVNITRAPQSEHDGTDVQMNINVEHYPDKDIIPNMTRPNRIKYITYYEDAESVPGKRTAVWELDKVNHRNIVRLPVLMRELWLEMWHDTHPYAKSKFVTKSRRGPLRDADCYWDYGKARCAWPGHCEYRYVFGDVHLGQSCRLKNNTSSDLLSHYL